MYSHDIVPLNFRVLVIQFVKFYKIWIFPRFRIGLTNFFGGSAHILYIAWFAETYFLQNIPLATKSYLKAKTYQAQKCRKKYFLQRRKRGNKVYCLHAWDDERRQIPHFFSSGLDLPAGIIDHQEMLQFLYLCLPQNCLQFSLSFVITAIAVHTSPKLFWSEPFFW